MGTVRVRRRRGQLRQPRHSPRSPLCPPGCRTASRRAAAAAAVGAACRVAVSHLPLGVGLAARPCQSARARVGVVGLALPWRPLPPLPPPPPRLQRRLSPLPLPRLPPPQPLHPLVRPLLLLLSSRALAFVGAGATAPQTRLQTRLQTQPQRARGRVCGMRARCCRGDGVRAWFAGDAAPTGRAAPAAPWPHSPSRHSRRRRAGNA